MKAEYFREKNKHFCDKNTPTIVYLAIQNIGYLLDQRKHKSQFLQWSVQGRN